MSDETTKTKANEMDELQSAIQEKGFQKGVKYMNDKINAQEQLVDIRYELKAFRDEGAYAISQAVKEVLGYFDMSSIKGASGDNIPELISVTLPDGNEIKIPWGRISLPGFDSNCYIELDYDYYDSEITISARVKKKDEENIKKVVDSAKKFLATESIYLGQAIELEFEDDEAEEPNFMDLSTIDENKILFSKNIRDGLVPILSRIKEKDKCIELGLDIKLGVLMEGIYGTGKTLVAFWLGKIAREYGWTFIYLKNCHNAAKALKISENYARNGNGVILFTEDIDQAIRGERGQEIQNIVNTLDGGDTKNLPIISIFTTNHIEVIEPTFLRGKRIGSLINFGVLDMDTATQFIDKLVVDKFGRSLMAKGDHQPAIKALCGIVPAFASEVIDKAKAYMIHRGDTRISNEDIVAAADSYKKQIEFAEFKAIDTNNKSETVLKGLAELIAHSLFNIPDKTNSKIQQVLADVYGKYNKID